MFPACPTCGKPTKTIDSGYKSPDFCVGDSGIPKYPKSWSKNEN